MNAFTAFHSHLSKDTSLQSNAETILKQNA